MKPSNFTPLDILEKALKSWPLDIDRTIHSIKTAIACLLGLTLVEYFKWPMGQWVPITVIVVMSAQTNFGAALQKAYMRFLGTIAAVITAIATLFLFDNNIWVIATVIFISCLCFTYVASSSGIISYAGTLGGTTIVLILTSGNVTITQAATRGIYIVIGIVIALIVSRFLFPIHAREKLRINVAKTLHDLQQLYFKTVQIDPRQNQLIQESNFDKIIMENLSLQPQLIEEAAAGSRYFHNYKKNLYIEVVSCERKIYRLIYFMQKSIHETSDIQQIMLKIRPIENLHIAIEGSLNNLADNIEKFTVPQTNLDLSSLLATINQITTTLPEETDVQKLLSEHSFLFLLEQIIKEIKMLYDLLQKILTTTTPNH